MILNKIDKIEFQDIVIDLRLRHKYTYSVFTTNAILELKNNQRIEQENGTAVDNPTVFINIASSGKASRNIAL